MADKVQEHWPGYIPRRYRDMGDGSYAERQVAAIEDASGQKINPAREDGNLASILAQLDITLSALRDAISGAGADAKTLNDLYGYLARYTQLPASLTTAGNLKLSVEEQAIALGIDLQARYNLKTIRDIAPTAVGTFYLPETGSIDLSNFIASTWGVYAPTTTNMVIDCYLQASHDGGTTWRRLAGYSISDADFVRDQWNTIDCPLKLAETRLEVVVATAYPVELDLFCIRKA